MKVSIFYSWQSDLSGKTNRYFIEDAIKISIKEVIVFKEMMDNDVATWSLFANCHRFRYTAYFEFFDDCDNCDGFISVGKSHQ